MISIDFYRFSYLFRRYLWFSWFRIDLQRFWKSKMFGKLIKHSFWRPGTPCTFRAVRFKLRRIYRLFIQRSTIRKKDVETLCEGICCMDFYTDFHSFSWAYVHAASLFFMLFISFYRCSVSKHRTQLCWLFVCAFCCFLVFNEKPCFLNGIQNVFSQNVFGPYKILIFQNVFEGAIHQVL